MPISHSSAPFLIGTEAQTPVLLPKSLAQTEQSPQPRTSISEMLWVVTGFTASLSSYGSLR